VASWGKSGFGEESEQYFNHVFSRIDGRIGLHC
jgi:hypothetical protein